MSALNRSPSDSSDFPLITGVGAGVLAFVAGYIVTFLVKSGQVSDNLANAGEQFSIAGVSPPADWQIIGWFFYQMHNVAIEVSFSLAGQSGTETIPTNVDAWLLGVPVVLLLLAGFGVAWLADVSTAEAGAKAGITVTAGYFVLVLVFAFLTTWSVSQSGGSLSFGPSLVPAAIIAGIAYPAILGTLGGVIAGFVRD
jgi:hypothetical protein